jgi:hypothetical protein
MSWRELKTFRQKRDAIILALCLTVAAAGLIAALSDRHNPERPDWVGLTGTVVDKKLKNRDDEIYGGGIQASLTIETENGTRIETRIPMWMYQDARIGDWVVGSKKSLRFYPRSPARTH